MKLAEKILSKGKVEEADVKTEAFADSIIGFMKKAKEVKSVKRAKTQNVTATNIEVELKSGDKFKISVGELT